MDQCIREAWKGNMNHRHGAVILRQGCTLVAGRNYMHTSRAYKSIHAEVDVIDEFKKRYPKSWLRSCLLVVVRANKKGELRDSAPCASCQKYIQKHGIPVTYYSSSTVE